MGNKSKFILKVCILLINSLILLKFTFTEAKQEMQTITMEKWIKNGNILIQQAIDGKKKLSE